MAGQNASRQVSGFPCTCMEDAKAQEDLRASYEDGEQDENDDDPGEIYR